MTVYIRLKGGYEDTYDVYTGCPSCGYPLKEHRDMFTYTKGGKCPNCGEKNRTEWGDVTFGLGRHNPTVNQGDDGSLSVVRWKDPLGFYPQGAWMSWRSD